MTEKQHGRTGDGGVVNQAMGNISFGMQAPEVIALVDHRVRELLVSYMPGAAAIGNQRIAELTNVAFEKIGDDPGRQEAFGDPAFLLTLREAQAAYASSGEPELRDMLSTVLAECTRAGLDEEEKVLLREAISVAPMLSPEHIALLALTLIATNPMPTSGPIREERNLRTWLDEAASLYLRNANTSDAVKRHLIYCRCVERNGGTRPIDEYFAEEYQNTFRKPIGRSGAKVLDELRLFESLFGTSLDDAFSDSFVAFFLPLSIPEWEAAFERAAVTTAGREMAGKALAGTSVGPEEIHELMTLRSETWSDLVRWQKTCMDLVPTSVGMTIAHSSLTANGISVPPLMECVSRIPY